jgi:hypothetical protein
MTAAVAHAAFAPDVAISSRSRFSDTIWHLDGIRPGSNRSDFSLDWGFTIGTGRFTDAAFTHWRDAAKTLLWSAKVDPPEGLAQLHDGTIMTLFKSVRVLIRWMEEQGYRRFSDLDRDASERFIVAMAQRRNAQGSRSLRPPYPNIARSWSVCTSRARAIRALRSKTRSQALSICTGKAIRAGCLIRRTRSRYRWSAARCG